MQGAGKPNISDKTEDLFAAPKSENGLKHGRATEIHHEGEGAYF